MPLQEDFKRRLEQVLGAPTAPFREGLVHRVIRDAASASRRLRLREDAWGNLEVVYGRGRPRLLFACHTDHPALEANGDGTATIVGGIRPAALKGAGLRLLDGDGSVAARAGATVKGRAGVVRLRGGRGLAKGTPLVLDMPGVRISKTRVRARAIDDGCAVAACLAMFDRLEAARWRGCVGALFTRAEEVGFAGALGWTRTTKTPRSTTVVNLEMSNARPHTPQGKGPILRVGDRMSIFDRDVAAELEHAAKALAGKDGSFRWQRALMDGGACEATVYAWSGFRTGALCLPLKNYHNHAAGGGVGMEYEHADDAESLVRWMVAYARAFGSAPVARTIAKAMDKRWRGHRPKLKRTARRAGEGRV